jgi:hypothetical protein
MSKFKCICGSCFTTATYLKKHQKLCKKPACEIVEPIEPTKSSKIDDNIEANSEASTSSFDTSTKATKQKQQKLKVISSKPTITFEDLCQKDFSITKDTSKLKQYALLGRDGITSLFRDILGRYKTLPIKYINIPTKKAEKEAECIIDKFENNIQIYKGKTWQPMTRDDTSALFYNILVALENNYPIFHEDDEEYDTELEKLYNNVDEFNVYSMVLVDIKDDLIDIIKTIC